MHNKTEQKNTNEDFARQIIARIRDERIEPKKRWEFFMRNIALWIPGVAITLIGMIAVAGTIFNAIHNGRDYREFTHPGATSTVSQFIPFIWLICFAVFGIFVIRAFRLTKHGYKYGPLFILGVSLGASVVLGILLYVADGSYKPNALIRYPTQVRERDTWLNPEEGRLAGTLTRNDDEVLLTDLRGTVWVLDTDEIPMIDDIISKGQPVRIVGAKEDGETFITCLVLPWEFGGPKPGTIKPLARVAQPPHSATCTEILERVRSNVPLPGNERKMEALAY